MTPESITTSDGAEQCAVFIDITDPALALRVRSALVALSCKIALASDDARVVIRDRVAPFDRPSIFIGEINEIAMALQNGASGGLRHSFSQRHLQAAIEAVTAGLICVDAQVLEFIAGKRQPVRRAMTDDADATSQPLTARESEVLALMITGASNKQIARSLGISVHTAKFHVAAIIAKLGATGRTDAVARSLHGDVMV